MSPSNVLFVALRFVLLFSSPMYQHGVYFCSKTDQTTKKMDKTKEKKMKQNCNFCLDLGTIAAAGSRIRHSNIVVCCIKCKCKKLEYTTIVNICWTLFFYSCTSSHSFHYELWHDTCFSRLLLLELPVSEFKNKWIKTKCENRFFAVALNYRCSFVVVFAVDVAAKMSLLALKRSVCLTLLLFLSEAHTYTHTYTLALLLSEFRVGFFFVRLSSFTWWAINFLLCFLFLYFLKFSTWSTFVIILRGILTFVLPGKLLYTAKEMHGSHLVSVSASWSVQVLYDSFPLLGWHKK